MDMDRVRDQDFAHGHGHGWQSSGAGENAGERAGEACGLSQESSCLLGSLGCAGWRARPGVRVRRGNLIIIIYTSCSLRYEAEVQDENPKMEDDRFSRPHLAQHTQHSSTTPIGTRQDWT